MDEELNEHDLEERLYAMLHHVDETQSNVTDSHPNKLDATQLVENGPRSTLRRYWRTENDINPYQKINTSTDSAPPAAKTTPKPDSARPKEERRNSPKPPSPVDLSIFQSPIPHNVKKTIEYLDHEDQNPVVLESSDEDEVVEVALPPKPTITIESSDEDELPVSKLISPAKTDSKSNSGERAVSASPVPSVVSSVSDEFIRGDCIALNISSRHPDKHSFDFSLHGSDLLLQNTPSKKKKRKKNKEAVTSSPINTTPVKSVTVADGCFATPKSKAKNKKQKSKSFTDKLQNSEVYDSDSNCSIVDTIKNKNPYIVTEKSLPSVDVYDSDSNQSEIVKEINTDQTKKDHVFEAYSSDSSASNDKTEESPQSSKKTNTLHDSSVQTVDLTGNDKFITMDNTSICENIVMANVTGLTESMDHGDENRILSSKKDISKYVSSKVPPILNADLDFDNLKGKDKICKRRPYSLTTLRAEMEKFYNESWGGEDFNHREIQKNMSRDKSLWAIDPKDRMPSLAQRKAKCNYCNRVGHRDDTCRQKPPVCYMCGKTGHFEPRCPSKICVNCGAPNFMYSSMCRNCSSWPQVKCAECSQSGHPSSHCPDVWRRYHNTINADASLEGCQPKQRHQQFCSGCSKRGHLIHSCRITVPFSSLPINSPFVRSYRPIYAPVAQHKMNYNNNQQRSKSFSQDSTVTSASTPLRPERNKRLSKSPIHETHANKKRNVSLDETEFRNTKSPVVAAPKSLPPKDVPENAKNKNKSKNLDSSATVTTMEKAPEFIAIKSSNHDNKGHVIQDNEVSDTSDVVTSARIYITNDIINKLKTKDGEDWLKATMGKVNVVIEHTDITSFLSIKGKLADQEAFTSELREWTQPTNKAKNLSNTVVNNTEEPSIALGPNHLPKNRCNLLRHLSKALDSLKQNLGDPQALYKELRFSQNKHEKLLKQKVISPVTLSHSRKHINDMLIKLNKILIGQAGLADGSQHVNELLSLKKQLANSRQKTISDSVREAIEEHYHIIFSSIDRNDYSELMKKYYLPNAKAKLNKRKRKQKLSKQSRKLKDFRGISAHESNEHDVINNSANVINNGTNLINNSANMINNSANMINNGANMINNGANVINNDANMNIADCNTNQRANHLRKLMYYHKRLKSSRRKGDGSAAAKQELAQLKRKVHAFIVILLKKEKLASKMSKKVKRVQEDAQKFLDGRMK